MVLEAKPISRLRHTHSRYVGLIDLRVLIVDVKTFYPRLTGSILPILNRRLEPDSWSAPAEIIQPKSRLDIVRDREIDLREKRWSPSAVIRWRDGKAKRVIERLVKVWPPKYRHL